MSKSPPRKKSDGFRPPWTLRARWYLERVLGYFVYWLARVLSRRRALSLANWLGDVVFRLFRRYRRVCLEGITIAFGDSFSQEEKTEMARSSQRNVARTVMDFLRFGLYSREELLALAPTVIGREHLEKAVKESNGGVIGLTAHLGSWEYAGAWVAATGWQVSAVGKEQRDPGITRIMLDQRLAAGVRHIPRTRRGNLELVRALRTKGTILGLLSDQNGGKDGVFVDFFDVPASSVRGPAFLALRYGVPVVPIFALWDGDTYRIEILPEVPVIRTGDEERDVRENTQRIQGVIEGMVRKHPGQWLWAHRRWKTRPTGEAPLYKW